MSFISKTCQDAAEIGTVVGVFKKSKTLQGKKIKVKFDFDFLYRLGHICADI